MPFLVKSDWIKICMYDLYVHAHHSYSANFDCGICSREIIVTQILTLAPAILAPVVGYTPTPPPTIKDILLQN